MQIPNQSWLREGVRVGKARALWSIFLSMISITGAFAFGKKILGAVTLIVDFAHLAELWSWIDGPLSKHSSTIIIFAGLVILVTLFYMMATTPHARLARPGRPSAPPDLDCAQHDLHEPNDCGAPTSPIRRARPRQPALIAADLTRFTSVSVVAQVAEGADVKLALQIKPGDGATDPK